MQLYLITMETMLFRPEAHMETRYEVLKLCVRLSLVTPLNVFGSRDPTPNKPTQLWPKGSQVLTLIVALTLHVYGLRHVGYSETCPGLPPVGLAATGL